MDVLVLAAVLAALASMTVDVWWECAGGPVLLVADGALVINLEGADLGRGGVLLVVHIGLSTVSSSPWAAERAGKLGTWDLAVSPGIPTSALQFAPAIARGRRKPRWRCAI